MPGHECYHCKQWVEEGEAHDCWTTTEAALTGDLSEDLQDAYERLRETAAEFGEQRIYASHSSIMFSRKSCYFFVRPKRKYLEVVVFLGRRVVAPQIKKVDQSSRTKHYHIIPITHRDQVETPITEWLREAYDLEDTLAASAKEARPRPAAPKKKARKAVKETVKKASKKAAVKKAAAKKAVAKKATPTTGTAKKAAAKKAAAKKAARSRSTRR
jgi:hypothetical protein